MRYTLRQLEIFLATAQQENLTKAAESLSMSQSAASGALKELESQFDINLFDRVGKRLQLNDIGRSLQATAEALLERANELENLLSNQSNTISIKLGATLSIGNYLSVPMIGRFLQTNPEAKINLEVGNTETIAHKIAHFELDIGLIEGEINNPDLEIEPWLRDELSVFCAPSHPILAKKEITDDDLLAMPWIVREPGSGTRQTFNRAMHDLLPKLNILLELQHTEAIKRAVEQGLGIGCLSKITLKDAFERGSLVPIQIKNRDFKRWLYTIIHKRKYQSEGIQQWLELCSDQELLDF